VRHCEAERDAYDISDIIRMMSKLTLSVDPGVAARAKRYAKRHGVSVSGLVETYLAAVVFSIAAVNQEVIAEGSAMGFADFEDAVTASAARLWGCDLIVTRDPRGFRGSLVRALPPEAVLPLLD
jgi:hypothetical protein